MTSKCIKRTWVNPRSKTLSMVVGNSIMARKRKSQSWIRLLNHSVARTFRIECDRLFPTQYVDYSSHRYVVVSTMSLTSCRTLLTYYEESVAHVVFVKEGLIMSTNGTSTCDSDCEYSDSHDQSAACNVSCWYKRWSFMWCIQTTPETLLEDDSTATAVSRSWRELASPERNHHQSNLFDMVCTFRNTWLAAVPSQSDLFKLL